MGRQISNLSDVYSSRSIEEAPTRPAAVKKNKTKDTDTTAAASVCGQLKKNPVKLLTLHTLQPLRNKSTPVSKTVFYFDFGRDTKEVRSGAKYG